MGVGTRNGPNGIWVAATTGSATPRFFIRGTSPSYSPAGDQIVFERDGGIFTMKSSDGTAATRIALGTEPNSVPKN